MGPRRSGKSSIERVVFHKMSPHETLFLESTNQVDVKLVANNSFVKFQTWDFGGDRALFDDVYYEGTDCVGYIAAPYFIHREQSSIESTLS